MPGGESKLIDHVPEFVVGSRPAMCQDQRSRAVRFTDEMYEMDVDAFYGFDILRKPVQARFVRTPIIGLGPVLAKGFQEQGVRSFFPALTFTSGRREPPVSANTFEYAVELRLRDINKEGLRHGSRLFVQGCGGGDD